MHAGQSEAVRLPDSIAEVQTAIKGSREVNGSLWKEELMDKGCVWRRGDD